MQAANADVFESWVADVVERWLSSEGAPASETDQFGETVPEYALRDYSCTRGNVVRRICFQSL